MGNRTLHKRVEELEEELVAIRKHIGLANDEEDDELDVNDDDNEEEGDDDEADDEDE